ncbi:MAG: ferritin-like domain-containing protein [Candidatus Binataceae bacterium]|nr:ferritin-like domain-containing protein [Candidatus Binataceae bacterium]
MKTQRASHNVKSSVGASATSRHPGSDSMHKSSAPNPQFLKDFISQMLAVEQGGVKLYERALSELAHEELRDQLETFRAQTEHHVELCEEMLRASGAEDDYLSPEAEAAEYKAEGLISTEVPEELCDMNNLENLVLAETKDHWNWEVLKSIASHIKEPELKQIAGKAVKDVFKEENDHVAWTQKMLTQVAMEMSQATANNDLDEDSDEDTEHSRRHQ